MSEVILATSITAVASIVCQMIISSRTQSLVEYRVGELERKVDKLSRIIEGMYCGGAGAKGAADGAGNIPHLPHFSHSAGSVL